MVSFGADAIATERFVQNLTPLSSNLYYDGKKLPTGSAIGFLNLDLKILDTDKLNLEHLSFRYFENNFRLLYLRY